MYKLIVKLLFESVREELGFNFAYTKYHFSLQKRGGDK